MLRKLSYILSYIAGGIYAVSGFSMVISCIMSFVEAGQFVGDPSSSSVFISTGVILLVMVGLFAALSWFSIFYGNKVKEATSRDEVKTLSIVALFLIGILPGLFCLIADESDFNPTPKPNLNNQVDQNAVNDVAQDLLKEEKKAEDDPIQKLKKLSELKAQNLISDDEYNEARKKIINGL